MTEIYARDPSDGVTKKFGIGKDGQTVQPEADVRISIENKSEWDKELLWSELKEGIINRYQEKGIQFDPNTIQNKADLDNAANILSSIEAREKAEAEINKPTPSGQTETANFYSPQQQGTQQTSYQLDESTDLNQLEFSDENQLIEALNTLNKKKNPQAKQILGTLAKKAFKNKNQEFVFEGRTKDLMRPDLPISPNMPESEQQIRGQYNENLRKNRCAWTQES
ncbi:MAG: hypothetical protein ABSD92_04360 [Candidatus Bathyarchaeia archaeon]|jgi:hypothetical protein